MSNMSKWTKDDEERAIAMYRNGCKIVDIAKIMQVPYRSVTSMLQRRYAMKSKTPDATVVAQLARMYTISEICEKMNISEYTLKNLASRYSIYLCKTRDQLPHICPMPAKDSYRTYATLANAVAQADAEKYAIVTKHTYMPNRQHKGKRCTSVEFMVINERNERLWDGLPLQMRQQDIYIKTPEGSHFCISTEEVLRLSNVINNVTIILTDNDDE